MARYRSGSISVDVSDVIDQIDDDDLLEEVARRKLLPSASGEAMPEDLVDEAYQELLRGRTDEARVILDRLLHPKFRSVKAAQQAFTKRAA